MKVREVYDIFFKTPDTTEPDLFTPSLVILAISPHGLLLNGQLCIKAEKYPGTWGSKYDHIYNLRKERPFDTLTGTYNVVLRVSGENFQASTVECTGKVLVPHICLPRELVDQPEAQRLMERIGTFFEIHFDNLKPNTSYAIRLVVDPQVLNLEFDPFNLSDSEGGESGTWEWDLSVISPSSLLSTVQQILERLNETNPGIAVPHLDVLTRRHPTGPWTSVLARRHRLYVLCGRGSTLSETATTGCANFMGRRQIAIALPSSTGKIPVRLLEWAGGSEIFPDDDPFEVAKEVLQYVRQWGTPDAKTKAEITPALDLKHESVSLMVDALVKKKLLQEIGKAKYTSGPECIWDAAEIADGKADHALRRIATSPFVLERFAFTGFELKYVYRFRHESATVHRRRRRKHGMESTSFWTGILGTVVGLIALVLTIVTAFQFELAVVLLLVLAGCLLAFVLAIYTISRRIKNKSEKYKNETANTGQDVERHRNDQPGRNDTQ